MHDRLTGTLGMDSLSQPVREAFLEKVTTTAMTGDSFSLQDIANQSDVIFGQLTPVQRQELLDFLETQYGIRLDSAAGSANLIEQIRGNMRQRLGNSEKATKAESEVQRALDDIVNFTSHPKNALLKQLQKITTVSITPSRGCLPGDESHLCMMLRTNEDQLGHYTKHLARTLPYEERLYQ